MALSNGWIVSIVLGVALVVMVVVVVIWFVWYRRKNYVAPQPFASDKNENPTANDRWDELLKNLEKDKIKTAHSYEKNRGRRVLTERGLANKPHVQFLEKVDPRWTTP